MSVGPSSILWPTVIVTLFFLVGHAFHYLLLATGTRLLAPQVFGLFFTSISLINVILTPGIVLTLVFAQQFAGLAATAGVDAVRAELKRTLGVALRWGGIVAAASALVLAALGALVGIQSFAVVLLAPAVSLAVFLFETIRVAFQGLRRFAWFGTVWVAWRALQCLLAAAAFYYVGTVWSGLAGILLATLVVSLLMLLALSPRAPLPERVHAPTIGTGMVVPFVVGYGLFTLLANADVLVAYLVLTRDELGVYAASSILPKAIVTATQPVAQVVLPVIVAQTAADASVRASALKGAVAALALGALGWVALTVGEDFVCDGRFGLSSCNGTLLRTLALAAVPLGMLRVFIVTSLASGARWQPIVQLLGLSVFSVVALQLPRGAYALAWQYLVACWSLPVLYAVVVLSTRHRRPVVRSRASPQRC
jgi:hypothetical protein